MPASARFTAIARRCATVSGRRGRSLLPKLAPMLELQCWHAGRRLDRSCVPPIATASTWSTLSA
jgi:hypothetical protein